MKKVVRIAGFIVTILFGAFLIGYGGFDDSPGAQMIGLVLVVFGVVALLRLRNR